MCLFTLKPAIHLSLLSLRLCCRVSATLIICHFLFSTTRSRCQYSRLLDVHSIVTRLLFRFYRHSINLLDSYIILSAVGVFGWNFFNSLRFWKLWCCCSNKIIVCDVVIFNQLIVTWRFFMVMVIVVTWYRIDHNICNYIILDLLIKLLFHYFDEPFLLVAWWGSAQRT